jgi:hypothetical protein
LTRSRWLTSHRYALTLVVSVRELERTRS